MGQKEHASSPINLETLRLIRDGFADSGMTQEELARATAIPRSSLANILSPTASPRLIHVSQLITIALALGVDPRDWAGELEAFERRRRGRPADDLARRRAGERSVPEVQKRAARGRSRKAAPAGD
ncbi:helix-turn-helix domain-containing protein [Nocardioides antri]|uniref:Helix-turn-helix transcriptional regulator n=1 Tax=Nocardioides antri TaxID=2607659 RepID=A0A5B1M5G3_9ACTN|nr:helix-turn-helix transcriptional regulator [Nocardioides antri]KAA1427876.1 helix-turn-helix transcriptional regulator [Nocardioides antri]